MKLKTNTLKTTKITECKIMITEQDVIYAKLEMTPSDFIQFIKENMISGELKPETYFSVHKQVMNAILKVEDFVFLIDNGISIKSDNFPYFEIDEMKDLYKLRPSVQMLNVMIENFRADDEFFSTTARDEDVINSTKIRLNHIGNLKPEIAFQKMFQLPYVEYGTGYPKSILAKLKYDYSKVEHLLKPILNLNDSTNYKRNSLMLSLLKNNHDLLKLKEFDLLLDMFSKFVEAYFYNKDKTLSMRLSLRNNMHQFIDNCFIDDFILEKITERITHFPDVIDEMVDNELSLRLSQKWDLMLNISIENYMKSDYKDVNVCWSISEDFDDNLTKEELSCFLNKVLDKMQTDKNIIRFMKTPKENHFADYCRERLDNNGLVKLNELLNKITPKQQKKQSKYGL